MKMSSKKTMLTAAVLVTLSSSTVYAATPGTVDSQELFRADRLVTDSAKNPAVEEKAVGDRYEASISGQRKTSLDAPAPKTAASAQSTQQPARLRWQSVDARLAARNNEPSFTLAAQKAKPVIITAEDIKREEKLAAKEGRPVQELVGDVNMNRPAPPPRPKKVAPADAVQNNLPADTSLKTNMDMSATGAEKQTSVQASRGAQGLYTQSVSGNIDSASGTAEATKNRAVYSVGSEALDGNPSSASAGNYTGSEAQVPGMSHSPSASLSTEQHPSRQRYPQLPHEAFSLMAPAENGAEQKRPDHFDALGGTSAQFPAVAPVKDVRPAVEHSVRPEGVPALTDRQVSRDMGEGLNGISDEVRRHILAGQLAMEVQLQRDPSVAGMRAITKILRENTTLTRLQKIDFLIGFGRALHQSGLPRQQEALLIKTIAEAF